MTHTFKTNLRCEGCVASIAPLLNGAPGIQSWSADVVSPDKLLTVEGTVDRNRVNDLLGKAGYQVLDELQRDVKPPASPAQATTSYFPLTLIVGYILGVTLLIEAARGTFLWQEAMTNFMAGFFLVFSFFKLLDLRSFADTYQGYDIIAAQSRAYAFAYPFIELALGLAYVLRLEPRAVNTVTLIVMLVGTIGVVRTLLARRKIRCACLGAVFNLPMSYVTLAEDGLMALMAALMLAM